MVEQSFSRQFLAQFDLYEILALLRFANGAIQSHYPKGPPPWLSKEEASQVVSTIAKLADFVESATSDIYE